MNRRFIRLHCIVEGQTEQTFVRKLLQERLQNFGIQIEPRLLPTSPKGAGGGMSYERFKAYLTKCLKEDPKAYFTTMIDLYKLHSGFPGFNEVPPDPYKKVQFLERELQNSFNSHRHFIPYIQLHEFEALLFSQVETIVDVLEERRSAKLAALQKIRDRFVTPEHINNGESTAPSKQLIRLYPGYSKVAFGSRIAVRIGLPKIRAECRHFNDWLSCLESLPVGTP